MRSLWDYLRYLLLALAVLHAVTFTQMALGKLAALDGLLIGEATPVAGDFINLYAAAQLTLAGRADETMLPDRFQAFERTIIAEPIGLRLWAYPPHSLLLIWPFGLTGFFVALALWSALGLAVLAWGARRLGFGWIETAIVLLSPGALHSVFYGQTGNLGVGLLLLALSARRNGDGLSAASAALLTIKPQLGLLLPLLWLVQRRWRAIALAVAGTLVLVGLSLLCWGPQPWFDYFEQTLPLLLKLERFGNGPFMFMMPSVLMAGRLLGLHADPALLIHLAFAATIGALLVWRLLAVKDAELRLAMVLLAAALISPYLHSYDLALLAAGAILVGRRVLDRLSAKGLLIGMLMVVVWALPNLLLTLNAGGVPIGPLPILALFLVAAFTPPRREA